MINWEKGGYKKEIGIAIIIYVIFNISLILVTNWGWGTGIKYFDFELIKDNFETVSFNNKVNQEHGCAKIAEYIENNMEHERIIVSDNEDRLPGAVETAWSALSQRWCSTGIIDSYVNFKEYVLYANIRGFMLSNTDTSFFRSYVEQLISEYGYEIEICDENAVFYKIPKCVINN